MSFSENSRLCPGERFMSASDPLRRISHRPDLPATHMPSSPYFPSIAIRLVTHHNTAANTQSAR